MQNNRRAERFLREFVDEILDGETTKKTDNLGQLTQTCETHPTFITVDFPENFGEKWVKYAIKPVIYKSLGPPRPHPPTFGSIVLNLTV